MSNFKPFADAVKTQFDIMAATGKLFSVDVDKDQMYDTYLGAFKPEDNPMFLERTVHDCNCCKSFIRSVGNAVAIIDDEIVTIWDIKTDGCYQPVADAMATLVRRKAIKNIFLSPTKTVGVPSNTREMEDGRVITFNHFNCVVPPIYVMRETDIPTKLGDVYSGFTVLQRGLKELTLDSLETIIELISQDSIYRGAEFLEAVKAFAALKREFLNVQGERQQEIFCWLAYKTVGATGRFRNTAIGTLAVDLSDNMPLEKAVASFESKVAPANYKRPKSLITPAMIKHANEFVQEKDMESALYRRHATIDDISVNDVLFANKSVKMAKGVFDELMGDTAVNPKKFDKVEEIPIDMFLNQVLPTLKKVELLVPSSAAGNFMSLVAPVNPESPNILKWGNNFSWSYSGNVADSMKEQVRRAGGNVEGALRFTHSWNHDGRNQSLMDLHVFMPGYNPRNTGYPKCHNIYPLTRRVGWNNRKDFASGGVQDVDHTAPPGRNIPLENISFPNLYDMPVGKYTLKIHNWKQREPNITGFHAEVEFDGQIYKYVYDEALADKEWVTVAVVTLDANRNFSIEHHIPHGTDAAKPVEMWGVNTNTFINVSMIMKSPNHWDGEQTGNMHTFFILEGCKNPDRPRGFYNEFLSNEFTEHRKVFEILAGKMVVEPSENQLSGVGFSSTKRASLLCRITGSVSRVVKINF
jgi:hypothetical protein